MALENPTYISDFVDTNPTSADPKSKGDDHIRNMKRAIQTTFPNITGEVTVSQADLNDLVRADGSIPFTADVTVNDGGLNAIHTGATAATYHARNTLGGMNLRVDSAGDLILGTTDTSGLNTEPALKAIRNGASTLYYDNVAALATSTDGVSITGGVSSIGSGASTFTDQRTSTDNTTGFRTWNTVGGGQIRSLITSGDLSCSALSGAGSSGDQIWYYDRSNGDYQIYHSGILKLETAANGVEVFGVVTQTGSGTNASHLLRKDQIEALLPPTVTNLYSSAGSGLATFAISDKSTYDMIEVESLSGTDYTTFQIAEASIVVNRDYYVPHVSTSSGGSNFMQFEFDSDTSMTVVTLGSGPASSGITRVTGYRWGS